MSTSLRKYAPGTDLLSEIEAQREGALEQARIAIMALKKSYELGIQVVDDAYVLSAVIPGMRSTINVDELFEQWRQRLDRAIWHRMMSYGNLWRVLGGKQRDAFEAQIQNNPPLATTKNIVATMLDLASKIDKFIGETVLDLFGRLHPRYASNRQTAFGTRFVVSDTGGGRHKSSKFQHLLTDLSQVLHYAHGKLTPEFEDGFYNSYCEGKHRGEVDFTHSYVRAKLYKNNNVHIWVEPEALERLNALLARHLPKGLSAHAA